MKCPHCAAAMTPLLLEGHYGQRVETDLCAACDLIWLDQLESVNLSGLGWVRLLRRMQQAQRESPGVAPMAEPPGCPRCGTRLKPVHNMSTLGRFGELECPRCRGGLAGFAQLLARRGLVRAMSRRDLDVLRQEKRDPACLNCGAALEREACARGLLDQDARCSYCTSPLLVLDMPRFFSALLMRHAEPVRADHLGWPCRGCGAPVEPTHGAACERCGHPVVVPSLLDLNPLLDQLEPILLGRQPRGPKAHGSRLRERGADYRATALYRLIERVKQLLLDR